MSKLGPIDRKRIHKGSLWVRLPCHIGRQSVIYPTRKQVDSWSGEALNNFVKKGWV